MFQLSRLDRLPVAGGDEGSLGVAVGRVLQEVELDLAEGFVGTVLGLEEVGVVLQYQVHHLAVQEAV
jgi:hypothetical protein